MILLISSVWEKEKVVKMKKTTTTTKKEQFISSLLKFSLMSLNHPLLFSSLHQNRAVWFLTLWNVIDQLEMQVGCKLMQAPIGRVGLERHSF